MGRKWLVRLGTNVNIWSDWWVGTGPIQDILEGEIEPHMLNWTVDRLMTDDGLWDLSCIQHIIPLTTQQEILAVPFPIVEGKPDTLV